MWHWPSCRFQGSVIASREYNDIVSIHIILIWQRPYYTVCGHMGHNVGRLRYQELKTVARCTLWLQRTVHLLCRRGTTLLCSAGNHVVGDMNVQAIIECRHSSSANDDYYWRIAVSGESWIVYCLRRSSACEAALVLCGIYVWRETVTLNSDVTRYWWGQAVVTTCSSDDVMRQ